MRKPNNASHKPRIYFYCGKLRHFFNECKECEVNHTKNESKTNAYVVEETTIDQL
jgi:hypothetical protein